MSTSNVEKILIDPDVLREIDAGGYKYYLSGPNKPNGRALKDGWFRFGGAEKYKAGENTGWKLHISVTRPEAMEELAQLGMRYRIPEFKFIGPDFFPAHTDPVNLQSGKTAVFYHHEKGLDARPIDWRQFAQDAELIVHRHGGPGPAVQRERQIPGSKAIYYRNDHGAFGTEYRPRKDLTQYGRKHGIPTDRLYNLANEPDPFAHIRVEPPTIMVRADVLRPKPTVNGETVPHTPKPVAKTAEQAMPPTLPPSETPIKNLEHTVQSVEKTAEKSHGKNGWIIGGIVAAVVGLGALIAMNNKRSHAEEERARREANPAAPAR